MRSKKLSFIAGTAAALSMMTVCMPSECLADGTDGQEPIFSSDFEEDSILDWAVFGGTGTLTLDTKNKQSGKASLNISGRQQSFNSPSVVMDAYFSENESYRITGWVYHEESTAQNLQCTVRYTDSVDVPIFRAVASIAAEPKTWTYFEGIMEVPEDTVSSFIYIESENSDLSYNIDNICVYGKAPKKENDNKNNNAQNNADHNVTSFSFGFEKGFEEWSGRGDMRLIRTNDFFHSGDYSVMAANRTRAWNGPTAVIDGIQREEKYNYSAYVMYNDPECANSHIFRLQLQYNLNGGEVYELIASKEAKKGEWTELAGTFIIPEAAQNVNLYIQTDNPEEGAELTYDDLMTFFVDDISVIRSDLAVGNKTKPFVIIAVAIGASVILLSVFLMIRKSKKDSEDEELDIEIQDLTSRPVKNHIPNTTTENKTADMSKDKKETPSTENNQPKAEEKTENKNNSGGKKEKNQGKNSSTNKNKNNKEPENSKESENKINRIFEVETFEYDEKSAPHTDDPLDTKNADGSTRKKAENTDVKEKAVKAVNTDTGIADAENVDPDNFQV